MPVMDDQQLHQRLRHVAEQVAARATAPGVELAVHRGRRRGRHRAGAALLVVVVLAASAVTVTHLATTVPENPAAGTSSGPTAGFPPVRVGPHRRLVGEPWPAVRLTEGGRDYRLVVYRLQGRAEPGQQWLCVAFQAAGMPPARSEGVCTSWKAGLTDATGFQGMHGRIANLPPHGRDLDGVAGRVPSRVARVRVWLRRGRVLLPPVTVAVVDGGTRFPGRYFAMLAPEGARYHGLDLLDAHGKVLCPDSSSCHP
jgi:hypothetical protein